MRASTGRRTAGARLPVLCDFESVSRADLKAVGGRRYWAHASTVALCVCWHDTRSGNGGVWLPGERWPHKGRTLGWHNGTHFDRFGAERYELCEPGADFVDTANLARKAGLPGALDALGTRLCGIPKDKAGSRFTRGLSTCRRPAGKGPEAISPADWKRLTKAEKAELGVQKERTAADLFRVVEYCENDVEIMAASWPEISPWLDSDWAAESADLAINDRGIGFDRELAAALLDCDAECADGVIRSVARKLGWKRREVREVAKSPQQFCLATGAPNAQAETVALMDHPIARARIALATIARGKLTTGLTRCCDDGRLRDVLQYYAAHTGRWGGKGMQLQNLPRPASEFKKWGDRERDALIARALARDGLTYAEVEFLIRPTLHAAPGKTFVVRDFSGVEARGLAWIAGDTRALEVFASGRDPYLVMAADIFGVSYESLSKDDPRRQAGKIGELACGYGMGWRHLGETALKWGIDLYDLGVDPKRVVDVWRAKHAPIVRFWKAVEDAFVRAMLGEACTVSCFRFLPTSSGSDVAIEFPSGRLIVYRDVRIRRHPKHGRPSISFLGTRGRTFTYGGSLVENITQALCRDFMAAAMVSAEQAGLGVVLTVHDELVCEVDRRAARDAEHELQRITTSVPDWGEGMPLDATGFTSRRYQK